MNAPADLSALSPQIATRPIPPTLLDALAVREQHGRDESAFTTVPPPAAVVFAESTQDVADAVRLAAAHEVPVIPFGVGSSLEGHLLAVQGGISIDLGRMNRVLAVHPQDLAVPVQAGVTRKQLNDEIKSTGLFFPIDPGADATLGGMSATRASGTNAVRYGTMRENVLSLEVVTAGGDVVRTGTRARKSSAGYDLTRLFVGSEGTLGIITEVTLRLYPLPEAVSAAICSFPSVADAVNTTIETIQRGGPCGGVNLPDHDPGGAVNAPSRVGGRGGRRLLMDFHGPPAGVREQAETVQEIAASHGGEAFEWASTPEERTRLWTARHNAFFAALQSKPGCKAITTDACVPISQLAEAVVTSVHEAEASGLPYFLVGHVGDGNFHMGYLIDPDSAAERQLAENLNHRLVNHALALGGTCTGEHGVGLHKMGFLRDEAGVGTIDLMRAIKQALDPKNILNPGKIFSL